MYLHADAGLPAPRLSALKMKTVAVNPIVVLLF
jgi:hypothetical protein